MATFHPVVPSLANFNDTVSLRFHKQLFSCFWHPNFLVNVMSTDHTLKQIQSHSQVITFVQLLGSFHLPSTLLICCTHATKESSWFWGCGLFFILPFIIMRILGIKHIFPCSFGNKHMHLLTRVYGLHYIDGPARTT